MEYVGSKVILVGEKIELEEFKQLNVSGIVCGGEHRYTENIPIHGYDYLLHKADDEKIIVVDDHWDFEVLYEFNLLMTNMGLRIGEDYIYNSMLKAKINTNRIYRLLGNSQKDFHVLINIILENKSLVIVHGNCQTHVVCNMLSNNEEFQKRYVVCEMPRLWLEEDAEEYEVLFESQILARASFFLTQKISETNRFGREISSESMISLISERCKVIWIPNLYFTGYFPQLKKYDQELKYAWWEEHVLPIHNEHIETEVIYLLILGKTDEDIIREISREDYYSEEFLHSNVKEELMQYKMREESIDIKMYDFLVDNYDKFLMFATPNHPTKDVLLELTRRILRKLGITDMYILCDDNEVQAPCPKLLYYPIYPSVLRAFGLRDRKYYFRAKLQGKQLLFLSGVNFEVDKILKEDTNFEHKEYKFSLMLDFSKYMLVYIRILRSILHT